MARVPGKGRYRGSSALGFRVGRPNTAVSIGLRVVVGVGKESVSSLGRVSFAEPSCGLTEVCDVRCASGSTRVGRARRRGRSRCAHSARGGLPVPGDEGPTASARSGVNESRWCGRARQCRRLIGDLRARRLAPARLAGSPDRVGRVRRDRCRSSGGMLDVIVDFGETAAVGVARLVIDEREAGSDAFGHGIQAVVDGGPVGSGPLSTAT